MRTSDKKKIKKDQLKESEEDKIFFHALQGIIQLPATQCIVLVLNKRGFPGVKMEGNFTDPLSKNEMDIV